MAKVEQVQAVCLTTGEVRTFKRERDTASYFLHTTEFFDIDLLSKETLIAALQNLHRYAEREIESARQELPYSISGS